jgi:radical SAM-linked protein
LLKYGPPLPVGVAGERENLDVALEEARSDLRERLAAVLPAGLRVRRARIVGAQSPPSIDRFVARCDYRAILPPSGAGGPTADELHASVDAFLASDTWLHVRRRPKGDVEIDVRPLVPAGGLTVEKHDASGEDDGAWRLRVTLQRDERGANLPVHEFLSSLLGDALAEPRWSRCTRTRCSGQDPVGRWRTPLEDVAETGRRTWLRSRIHG